MNQVKRKLLFTGKALPDKQRKKFEALGFEVVIERPNLTEDELIGALQDIDAHILCGAEKFTARVLKNAPKLKVISFFGVGYETYIDSEAATQCGIAVTNAPGANSRSVAEFTMALILDAVKNMPEMITNIKQGLWQKDVLWDLHGRTLGIVGLGEIGSRLAQIAHHGFGMKVVYSGRSSKPDQEKNLGAGFLPLDELLSCSDVVSLNTIETDHNRFMIGNAQLELMQPHAVLVNTARPNLVDLAALYKALQDGSIACAAFDCYYEEPAPAPNKDKYGLLSLPANKFILTPHAGFFSKDAAENTSEMALQNISAVFEGSKIPNLVNPDYSNHI